MASDKQNRRSTFNFFKLEGIFVFVYMLKPNNPFPTGKKEDKVVIVVWEKFEMEASFNSKTMQNC